MAGLSSVLHAVRLRVVVGTDGVRRGDEPRVSPTHATFVPDVHREDGKVHVTL